MSGRLSILGISFIGYLIILLSNTEVTPVRIFVAQLQVPVFYVISISTLFGVFITLLFLSMLRRDRKIKSKLRILVEQKENTQGKKVKA